MVKICHVNQIKLNQLVSENVHMITDLPAKYMYERYQSDKQFLELLPGGKNQRA